MKRVTIATLIILSVMFSVTGCKPKTSTKLEDSVPTVPWTEATIESTDVDVPITDDIFSVSNTAVENEQQSVLGDTQLDIITPEDLNITSVLIPDGIEELDFNFGTPIQNSTGINTEFDTATPMEQGSNFGGIDLEGGVPLETGTGGIDMPVETTSEELPLEVDEVAQEEIIEKELEEEGEVLAKTSDISPLKYSVFYMLFIASTVFLIRTFIRNKKFDVD